MTYRIIKIREEDSRYGGRVYHIFFKDENNKSWRTYVSPKCGNYLHWSSIVFNFLNDNKQIYLKNLKILNEKKRLLDADSQAKIVNF